MLRRGILDEYERLAQREAHETETEFLEAMFSGSDVWAQGFVPEDLANMTAAAAERLPGPVVFISPEAELLRNREQRLKTRTTTTLLDPADPESETHTAEVDGKAEGARIIWCTLEALTTPELQERLVDLEPRLWVVESAHAISPAAQELRPALAQLPKLRERCGAAPVVAVTRSAKRSTREDACTRLRLVDPRVVHGGLIPQRTRLSVATAGSSPSDLCDLVERLPRPSVVFCQTPAQADLVYGQLSAAQIPVHRFHDGLPSSERATEILHFTLPGRRAVMVATSAFRSQSGIAGLDFGQSPTPGGLGLGFVRRGVRSLVHLTAPASLEQYANELSLLTRTNLEEDEGPIEAVLFFAPEHVQLNDTLLSKLRITGDAVRSVVSRLAVRDARRQSSTGIEVETLAAQTGLGRKAVTRVLVLLVDKGVIARKGQGFEVCLDDEALAIAVTDLAQDVDRRCRGDEERLHEVVDYAEAMQCRVSMLRALLGETNPAECGLCDVCAPMVTRRRTSQEPNTTILPRRRATARTLEAGHKPDGKSNVVSTAPRRSQLG